MDLSEKGFELELALQPELNDEKGFKVNVNQIYLLSHLVKCSKSGWSS